MLQVLFLERLLFLYALVSSNVQLYTIEKSNTDIVNNTASWFSSTKCAIRHSFVDVLKSFINCTTMKELNGLCGRNITVMYSDLPPYIFMSPNGKVTGILAGKY